MPDHIQISDRLIGIDAPSFIIAEAGVNHNGSLGLALELIDAAAASGADAIKFQTFIPEEVVSEAAPKADYQLKTTDTNESQLDMERRLALPFDAFHKLKQYAERQDLIFLSSPFDIPSVEFLANIGVPALKIPSGELTHTALLRTAGATGLPLLISTGMADLSDVEAALETVKQTGAGPVVLLHCTSNYPAKITDSNLRAITTMRREFQCLSGFSDHTEGFEASVLAVAMGAVVIEKHFTLDRDMAGPDHKASLDTEGFRELVDAIRHAEAILGDGIKAPRASEKNTADVARRSLFLRSDVAAGHYLKARDVIALRPSGGIAANQLDAVIGRSLKAPMQGGTILRWEDLS